MSKLLKAPLLEVIFEINWDITNKNDIIEFQYLHGDMYSNLKNSYSDAASKFWRSGNLKRNKILIPCLWSSISTSIIQVKSQLDKDPNDRIAEQTYRILLNLQNIFWKHSKFYFKNLEFSVVIQNIHLYI